MQNLVDRGRGDRAIFEVLPPQRRTLAEKGLLGSSRRAVVVSLPTSSGKTLLVLEKNKKIASTYAKVSNLSTLAAVAAQELQKRGPVIVMHTRPDWVWSLAEQFKIPDNRSEPSKNIKLVQRFLEMEFGESFPLIELMSFGVGVHHAGLSDDVRMLMEWLFESDELKFLVATTTLAQGVNFPVTRVVMASHQYPYGSDMPPEDFWNIAGRAGRIGQGSLGVVALVAEDAQKADTLQQFIERQSGDLNSALIELARKASEFLDDLEGIVYRHPQWSTFVQYLAHTYRQMGQPEGFADEIEQVLRNTFGFEKLRVQARTLADSLLEGVHAYAQYLQKPKQPIELVDSTGFSLQSIRTVLGVADEEGIGADVWNAESLFSQGNQDLRKMMGILIRVPELRENLEAVTGGSAPGGDKLARIIKDWVNGASVPDIARQYFRGNKDDDTQAITKCGQNLFGNLAQTAAWGLGALLSITGSRLTEDQMKTLKNLPSWVYYGVNSDKAIVLRLLGVPRSAVASLAGSMGDLLEQPLANVRSHLGNMDEKAWRQALGEREGGIYREVWRVLEGLE